MGVGERGPDESYHGISIGVGESGDPGTGQNLVLERPPEVFAAVLPAVAVEDRPTCLPGWRLNHAMRSASMTMSRVMSLRIDRSPPDG